MSLMKVTVNTQWDISFGVLTHNVLAPPAVPTPTPMISIEMIATQHWPPGFVTNKNKLTTTVKHLQQNICLNGHDCGMMVLDITPLMPANAWYAIMWPFSSRKITFMASTVKMNGTETGCAQMAPIPLPMMTCGDPVSAPTAIFMFNCFTRNVKVGMTLGDLLFGLLNIAISIAIDFLWEKFAGGNSAGSTVQSMFGRQVVSREGIAAIAKTAVRSIGRELLQQFGMKVVESFVKSGVAGLAGLGTSPLQGNPTFEMSGGMPGAEVGVTVNNQGVTGTSNVLGRQRDTRGGGQNYGEPL